MLDLMEDEVHKELAEEEEARRRNGGQVLHDMSPSAFLKFGFTIEESQFINLSSFICMANIFKAEASS